MSRGSSALSGSLADYRRRIAVDNGTEFTSKALEHWATGTESNSTSVGRGSPSTRFSASRNQESVCTERLQQDTTDEDALLCWWSQSLGFDQRDRGGLRGVWSLGLAEVITRRSRDFL